MPDEPIGEDEDERLMFAYADALIACNRETRPTRAETADLSEARDALFAHIRSLRSQLSALQQQLATARGELKLWRDCAAEEEEEQESAIEDAIRGLISVLVVEHGHEPPWRTESDWTEEVYSQKGIVAKCADVEGAQMLVRFAAEWLTTKPDAARSSAPTPPSTDEARAVTDETN